MLCRVLGVQCRVLGVLRRVLGVLRRVLGVLHRVNQDGGLKLGLRKGPGEGVGGDRGKGPRSRARGVAREGLVPLLELPQLNPLRVSLGLHGVPGEPHRLQVVWREGQVRVLFWPPLPFLPALTHLSPLPHPTPSFLPIKSCCIRNELRPVALVRRESTQL